MELEEFYSADSKSEFYYDSVLSCDEVREKKSFTESEVLKMQNQSFYQKSYYGIGNMIMLPFAVIESNRYQNLEERLENLKSLQKEKCKTK